MVAGKDKSKKSVAKQVEQKKRKKGSKDEEKEIGTATEAELKTALEDAIVEKEEDKKQGSESESESEESDDEEEDEKEDDDEETDNDEAMTDEEKKRHKSRRVTKKREIKEAQARTDPIISKTGIKRLCKVILAKANMPRCTRTHKDKDGKKISEPDQPLTVGKRTLHLLRMMTDANAHEFLSYGAPVLITGNRENPKKVLMKEHMQLLYSIFKKDPKAALKMDEGWDGDETEEEKKEILQKRLEKAEKAKANKAEKEKAEAKEKKKKQKEKEKEKAKSKKAKAKKSKTKTKEKSKKAVSKKKTKATKKKKTK